LIFSLIKQLIYINKNSKIKKDLISIVCESSGSNSSIRHYTAVKLAPLLFDEQRPAIGLSDAKMSYAPNGNNGTNITCEFKRDNMKPDDLVLPEKTKYIDIGANSALYVLWAYGPGLYYWAIFQVN
jgi:hypothetical protein